MWYFITLVGIVALLCSLVWFIIALLRNKQKSKAVIAIAISGIMLASGASNVKNERAANGEIPPEATPKEQVTVWSNKVDSTIKLVNNNVDSLEKTLNTPTNDANLYSDLEKLKSKLDNIDIDLTLPKCVKTEKEEEFNKAVNDFKLGLNYRSEAYNKLLKYVDSKKPSDLADGKEYLRKSIFCLMPAAKTIDNIKTDIVKQYR